MLSLFNSFKKIETVRINDSESLEVFNNSQLTGEPFNGIKLEKKHLQEYNLFPHYKVAVTDGIVYFSDLFYMIDNRLAVLGYVQMGKDKPVIHSYYRSNSQGVWRYLADYTLKNKTFDWYVKGHEHGHITPSITFQRVLADIESHHDHILQIPIHELIFAGTARERKSSEPFFGTAGPPIFLDGNFYPNETPRIRPEDMMFHNKDQRPDFNKSLTKWSKQSTNYITISVEIISSANNEIQYMFCTDSKKRVWIGMIENTKGAISSTGIRSPWIHGGDLLTPAYEYAELTYGYGNELDRNGPYVDMYLNYLQRIPVIHEYIQKNLSI